jgi:hypothetical protein
VAATFQNQIAAARTKWAEGRKASESKQQEVREEARVVIDPVKEKINESKDLAGQIVVPVLSGIQDTVDPIVQASGREKAKGKSRPLVTSFGWSMILAWAVNPIMLMEAMYDRALGSKAPRDWGLLMGPGRWFRDTIVMAWETGQKASFTWAVVIGLLPMVIGTCKNVAQSNPEGALYNSMRFLDRAVGTVWGVIRWALCLVLPFLRGSIPQKSQNESPVKWLTRLSYATPLFYLLGLSYPGATQWLFGVTWTLQWWQVGVMALTCFSYYGVMWALDRMEDGKGFDMTHVIIMMPLASMISGYALNGMDAAM